ncbi:PilZ domain-containing protein [Thiomicrorhabdus sediminis]|uniref:PilZ domain-containing protein n=1 Tax=Thiomicrorhabdus sediminis TaxID=2580412 RepID=A0A4V1HI06_9GAMM|nr:PilZ domain-containing protein [Thiomicrorhabdus sediminis]QCU90853.1 PilZ domain-containing protein [Thiomicrorhabdus sediminis]
MTNVRRYFRYDVILPMHLEMVDRYGKHVSTSRRQLISEQEEEQLHFLNAQIKAKLDKLYSSNSNAFYIFYSLNQRMSFMWWLIDQLVDTTDPREQRDYRFRLKEDAKFDRPKTGNTSKIGPLIAGLYDQIEDYIRELVSVVDNSVDGKIFKYTAPSKVAFDEKKYVSNLDKLAQQGVIAAKVLRLLVDTLNLQTNVYERLKQAYKGISQPENWMNYRVNLSAGGFSFLSVDPYERFSSMDVFMEINDEVLVCRGKIVSQTASNDQLFPYRIGVEFDLLTTEQEQSITLFEQHKELQDAMVSVPI